MSDVSLPRGGRLDGLLSALGLHHRAVRGQRGLVPAAALERFARAQTAGIMIGFGVTHRPFLEKP